MNIIMLAMRLLRNRDRLPDFSDLLDRLTPDKPEEKKPESAYPVGSVEWLQESLNTLNHAGLVVDGDYGELTREAVKDYQQVHGLKVDGWAGPETISSVVAELANAQTSAQAV
jgi:murein L,D-transpeptidase YcbB/YkuD